MSSLSLVAALQQFAASPAALSAGEVHIAPPFPSAAAVVFLRFSRGSRNNSAFGRAAWARRVAGSLGLRTAVHVWPSHIVVLVGCSFGFLACGARPGAFHHITHPSFAMVEWL